jgi:hypothetical protein
MKIRPIEEITERVIKLQALFKQRVAQSNKKSDSLKVPKNS